MKLVIIESPLAGDYENNREYAKRCMKDSLARGEAPYASHLLFAQEGILDDTNEQERELGIEAGLAWGKCAELTALYIDLGVSPGMQRGIKRALAEGRPVEIRSLNKTLPPGIRIEKEGRA